MHYLEKYTEEISVEQDIKTWYMGYNFHELLSRRN